MEPGRGRLTDAAPSDWVRCKFCMAFISTSSFIGHRDEHRKERLERGVRGIGAYQNGWRQFESSTVRIKQEIPVIDLANSDGEEAEEFVAFPSQSMQDSINYRFEPSTSPTWSDAESEFGSDLNLLKCEECQEYFFTRNDYDNHNAKYHCETMTEEAESQEFASALEEAHFEDFVDTSATSCTGSVSNPCSPDSPVKSPTVEQRSNNPVGSPMEEGDLDEIINASDSSIFLDSNVTYILLDNVEIITGSSDAGPQEVFSLSVEEPASENCSRQSSEPTSPSALKHSKETDDEQFSIAEPSKKQAKRKKYPYSQEYYVQRAAAKKNHQYNDNICPYCDKDCQTSARWESHVLSKHESRSEKKNRPVKTNEKTTVVQTNEMAKRTKNHISPKMKKKVENNATVKRVKQKFLGKIDVTSKAVKPRSKDKKNPEVARNKKSNFVGSTKKHVDPSMKSRRSRMYSTHTRAQCQYCKVWITKQGLAYHERVHTGEKPFGCKFCGNKFRGRPSMYRHEQICKHQMTVILPNNRRKKISVRAPTVRTRSYSKKSVPNPPPRKSFVEAPLQDNLYLTKRKKRKSLEVMETKPAKLIEREEPPQKNEEKEAFSNDILYLCDVCDFATFRVAQLDIHVEGHVAKQMDLNRQRNVQVSKDSSLINSLRCKFSSTTEIQSKLKDIKDDGPNRLLLSPINKCQVVNEIPSTSLNSYRCLMCLRVYGGESVIRQHIKVFHGQTLQTSIRTDEDPSLGKRILKLAKRVSSNSRPRGRAKKFYDPSDELVSVDEALPRLIVKVHGERVAACSVFTPRSPESSGDSQNNAFPCEYCSQKFVNHAEYLLHVIHHKGAAVRSCGQCGKTFLHSEFYLQHMIEAHNDSPVNKNGSAENRKELSTTLSENNSESVQNEKAANLSLSGATESDLEKNEANVSFRHLNLTIPSREIDNGLSNNESSAHKSKNNFVPIEIVDTLTNDRLACLKDNIIATRGVELLANASILESYVENVAPSDSDKLGSSIFSSQRSKQKGDEACSVRLFRNDSMVTSVTENSAAPGGMELSTNDSSAGISIENGFSSQCVEISTNVFPAPSIIESSVSPESLEIITNYSSAPYPINAENVVSFENVALSSHESSLHNTKENVPPDNAGLLNNIPATQRRKEVVVQSDNERLLFNYTHGRNETESDTVHEGVWLLTNEGAVQIRTDNFPEKPASIALPSDNEAILICPIINNSGINNTQSKEWYNNNSSIQPAATETLGYENLHNAVSNTPVSHGSFIQNNGIDSVLATTEIHQGSLEQLSILIPPQQNPDKAIVPYSVASDPISPALTEESYTASVPSPVYFTAPSLEWPALDIPEDQTKEASTTGNSSESSFTNLEMLSLIATLEPRRSPVDFHCPVKSAIISSESKCSTVSKIVIGKVQPTVPQPNNNNGYYENANSFTKNLSQDKLPIPSPTGSEKKFANSGDPDKMLGRRQCPQCIVNYQNQQALEDHIAKVHPDFFLGACRDMTLLSR